MAGWTEDELETLASQQDFGLACVVTGCGLAQKCVLKNVTTWILEGLCG